MLNNVSGLKFVRCFQATLAIAVFFAFNAHASFHLCVNMTGTYTGSGTERDPRDGSLTNWGGTFDIVDMNIGGNLALTELSVQVGFGFPPRDRPDGFVTWFGPVESGATIVNVIQDTAGWLAEGTFDIPNCSFTGTVTFSSTSVYDGTVTFNATGTPVVAAENRFWIANDGNFDTALNWQPEGVPTTNDVATFDRLSSYTVTVGTAQSLRLLVENGTVTLTGTQYNAVGNDPLNPSVVVGNSSTGNAILTLNNIQLIGPSGSIGNGVGTTGFVNVANAASSWLMSSILDVGTNGSGTLSIDDGGEVTSSQLNIGDKTTGTGDVLITGSLAKLTTGTVTVGSAGKGEIEINNGSLMCQSATIAADSFSTGDVTVQGATGFGTWSVTDGDLIVGKFGDATLTINNGNHVDVQGDMVIAQGNDSTGAVTVSGTSVAKQGTANLLVNLLGVGGQGTATLTVDKGATVNAGEMVILEDTVDAGTPSQATVTGNGTSMTILDTISVGGILSIQDSARVNCDEALVGSVNVGSFDGAVDVGGNALWDLAGLLNIGDPVGTDPVILTGGLFVHDGGTVESTSLFLQVGSFIQGNGTIVTAVALLDGTIDPRTSISKQVGGAGAELTFDGDVTLSGILEIDVAGLAAGEFDVLAITGNADLTGATIRMNFQDGFLPKAGDQIPFLVAGGVVTLDGITREFTGVADGFDYTVTESGGMLMLEALNDAVALAVPGLGCSAGSTTGNALSTFPILVTLIVLALWPRRRSIRD